MANTSNSLKGKVALVTGASRGIGAAIAKRLAAEGAAVAITYANSPEKAEAVVGSIKAADGQAVAIRADSADSAAVKNAITTTVDTFGRLDILVNNAGVIVVAPVDQISDEDFDRLVAVNIKAVFVATREAVQHMGEGGRIITIGSTNADRVPFPGASVYAMSKSAIVGLTKGLARDLGPRGITVNNIQPGPINTDMNPQEGPFAEVMKGFLALPRYGRDEEIAAMVAYIAGPEAGFVTGASLTIDGGFGA